MTFYKNSSPVLYSFLDSKHMENNDLGLFLKSPLMPCVNRHWMPAECHFSVYLFLNPPSLYQGGNEGLGRLCSFPRLILNQYCLVLSTWLIIFSWCLALCHAWIWFTVSQVNQKIILNYQLLIMKSWEWGRHGLQLCWRNRTYIWQKTLRRF